MRCSATWIYRDDTRRELGKKREVPAIVGREVKIWNTPRGCSFIRSLAQCRF